MEKLLLTCSGIEGKNIVTKFTQMLGTKINNAKILWVPTAAIDDESVDYAEKCRNDLLHIGIRNENITTYNLGTDFTPDDLNEYDAVFVCGGDCRYLLDQIHKAKFDISLKDYVGLYIGVSAGSCIASYDFDDGLSYLKCRLDVHCSSGTPCGIIDVRNTGLISLTNSQAVVIENDIIEVIGED